MLDAPSVPAAMFVAEDEIRSSQRGEEQCRVRYAVESEFGVDRRQCCPDPGVLGVKECVGGLAVVAFPSSSPRHSLAGFLEP